MIQLFLDGMPAVISDNSASKLSFENSFFTKAGAYSYELELPLKLKANRDIFGFLNRLDSAKKERSLTACLMINNSEAISGTAHITSINEESVKVQILGGVSAYNYGNKMENTYIDSLDLGDWYMTTWPDGSYYTDPRTGKVELKYYPAGTRFRGATVNILRRMAYDTEHDYPWVAFPTINSTAGVFCNGFYYQFKDSTHSTIERYDYRTKTSGELAFCIQPYVWIMAQKIAEATGFELPKEDNDLFNDILFRKIFIVNSTNNIDCAKCLPHWSVNEWWTNLENAFGLVFSVNYATKRASLLKRRRHYSEIVETTEITQVEDMFNAEIDDETQSDISSCNVGFADFENDAADRLSDYINEFSTLNKDFSDISELSSWAGSQGTGGMANYKDVVFECADGRRYIYMENHDAGAAIVEVDMFRNRIVKESSQDIDVELKFVPGKFVDYVTEMFDANRHGSGANGSHGTGEKLADIDISVLEVPGASQMAWCNSEKDYDKIDIEAILKEEEEEDKDENSLPDIIYIAIDNGKDTKTATTSYNLPSGAALRYNRPVLRERTTTPIGETKRTTEDSPYSLSLIPVSSQINLASQTIVAQTKIDTTVRICIRFISNSIPKVENIFLIRNRKYVCEKLEAKISNNRLDHLMTGYFYELSS